MKISEMLLSVLIKIIILPLTLVVDIVMLLFDIVDAFNPVGMWKKQYKYHSYLEN